MLCDAKERFMQILLACLDSMTQKINQIIEINTFLYVVKAQLKCDIFDSVLEN